MACRKIGVGVAAAALVVCNGWAVGQCDPVWETAIGNPGIVGGYIQPMAAWDDGTGEKVYVGGSATGIGGDATINYLGQYDPVTGAWSRLGTGIDAGTTNAFLNEILPWNDGTGEKLYVIGQFAGAGGVDGTNGFAAWDGTAWQSVGAGFAQDVLLRVTYDMLPADLDGTGEKLIVAGNFAQIGGVPGTAAVAVFDGQTFSPLGGGGGMTGFSPFISQLADWDDGTGRAIYACGRFDSIDGAVVKNVARYRVSTGQWEAVGAPLIPASPGNVNFYWAVFDDGTGEALYMAGQQFRIDGVGELYNVAKWDGTSWTGVLGPGQVISGRAISLAVWDDGNGPALYMAGSGMRQVNNFAKLVNGVWEPVLGGGINNPSVTGGTSSAFGLAVWGDRLLVGGSFSQVGGQDPVSGFGMGVPIAARGIAAVAACEAGGCAADWDGDEVVNSNDISAFLTAWLGSVQGGTLVGDFDGDMTVNSNDISAFLTAWLDAVQNGC